MNTAVNGTFDDVTTSVCLMFDDEDDNDSDAGSGKIRSQGKSWRVALVIS